MRALLLLVASGLPIASAETAGQELERMERLWRQTAVGSYVFVSYISTSPFGRAEYKVTVRDGVAVRIEEQTDRGRWRRIDLGSGRKRVLVPPLTVEQTFQKVRVHLDPSDSPGKIQFDPSMGFPVRASFDISPDIDDDELEIGISLLKRSR